MQNFSVILYNHFESLDVFGPVEVIGKLDKFFAIEYYSEKGGIIQSSQNTKIETRPLKDLIDPGILLIPGGFGARVEVNNANFIDAIKELSIRADVVLTVCTGSALLAKTGLLNNIQATTNKISYDWVVNQNDEVCWIRKARWTHDAKYYTSSGVSAGIDMTLGFISDRMSPEIAERVASGIEYLWNRDKENDPFC